MCTCVRIMSKENHCFWGRTSEFDVPLDYVMVAVPRGYRLHTETPVEVKYGFIGVGCENLDLVQDGINEAGLAASSQYFANENRYSDPERIVEAGKKPVRGEELCTWILSQYASVQEIKQKLNQEIAASNSKGVLGYAVPQHVVFYDTTGASVVVEPSLDRELRIYDNPLGMMTNQPGFDWHLKNLYNYAGLGEKIHPQANWHGQQILSAGKGSGLFGLPGDFTPQSRFVRAAVLSNLVETPSDDFGVQTVFHILNSFDIPRGVIETVAYDTPQHTMYTSAYDCERRTLYYHDYHNRAIQKLEMTEEDMSKDHITVYRLQKSETILDVRKMQC